MTGHLEGLREGDPVRITLLSGGYWIGEIGARFVEFTKSGRVKVRRWDRERPVVYSPENVRRGGRV